MTTEKRAVLVRFYPEVHKKLQSIAEKDKRTVTNLVEYLVETSLSKIEPENKKTVYGADVDVVKHTTSLKKFSV